MLKPVPKKDRPKVIALSVLAAGLAGTAVMQFNSGDPRLAEANAKAAALAAKNGTATVASAGARTARGATAPGVIPGGTRTPGASASLVTPASAIAPGVSANVSLTRIVNDNGAVFDLGAVGPPIGGKNPFSPASGSVAAASPVVIKPPVIAPVEPAAAPAPDFGGGRLDNLLNKAGITSGIPKVISRGGGVSIAEVMNGGGGNGGNNAGGFPSAASTVAVVLPPPPLPAVMVTGIVVGIREPGFPAPSNVAVVRGVDGGASASSERRFVSVGDSIGNGFVVVQVRANGIIIKSTVKGDNRRVTLHIGEKATSATGAAVPVAANTSLAPSAMGKDAPQNTDKNTNDKNTVPASASDVLKSVSAAASASATTGSAGSPLGETFRAK